MSHGKRSEEEFYLLFSDKSCRCLLRSLAREVYAADKAGSVEVDMLIVAVVDVLQRQEITQWHMSVTSYSVG